MSNFNLENLDILDNIDLKKSNNDLGNTLNNDNHTGTDIDINNIFESDIETLDINNLFTSEIIITDIKDIIKSNNSTIDLKNIIESDIEKFDINSKKNYIENNDSIILEENKINNTNIPTKKRNSLIIGATFLFKYLLTSSLIFGILLITTNYNAYISVARSYVFQGELESKEQKLISSVEASVIKEKYSGEKLKEIESKSGIEDSKQSIRKMKKAQDKENIDLNIDITPYENRIIIPKIGKNIPLVDIKNRNIGGQKELNNIFMKELENGVVRYPGSALPGKIGTSFIFGHSSNFPWIKGEYNDIFALLDKVTFNDEIVVYYGQEKYVYKINEKKVISPGDVSVLERNKKKSEITLMTCWPIGTTLNRLIVVGELVDKK